MDKLLYTKMGIDKNFIFKIDKCPLMNDFKAHTHDFSELVIILSGTALHIVNGCEYHLKPGDTFIIHKDVNHGYMNVDGLVYANIMYESAIIQNLTDLKKLRGFQALFYIEPYYRRDQSFNCKLTLTSSQLKKAKALIDVLIEESRLKVEGHKAMLSSYFTALIILLSRCYAENENEDNKKILQIAEAITYIEQNFLSNIALTQLSEMAHVSSRHFVRVFKKNYGRTPLDYAIHLRLDYAAKLIKETNLSISDIALESGFNDHNYFTRQFHKVYGIPPTRYRIQL